MMDWILIAMAVIVICNLPRRIRKWRDDGFEFTLPSIGKILIIVGVAILLLG